LALALTRCSAFVTFIILTRARGATDQQITDGVKAMMVEDAALSKSLTH
jgi:hypothetical protein